MVRRAVRFMFWAYMAVILAGLAFYITVGALSQ